MREIQRGDRYQPAYEGRISELITAVEFTPYTAKDAPRRPGWLFLSTLDLNRNDRGWYSVRMTEKLVRAMQSRSIFGPSLDTAYQDHYLSISKRHDGKVYLCMEFSQISGSYNLIELDEADQAELLQALDAAKS